MPEDKENRNNKRRGRGLRRALWISLVVIILLPGLFYSAVGLYLKPERLTRIVHEICEDLINADVSIDTIAISMFSEFPNIGLRLINGSVISRAYEDTPDSLRSSLSVRADSLLHFKEIVASVNLPSLLRMKPNIKGIRFEEPDIYAYVSKWGKANWDIFPESEESESSSFSFNIKRIDIIDAKRIAYNDRSELMYVNASADRIVFRGNMGSGKDGFSIDRAGISNFMMLLNLEPEQFAGRVIIDSLSVNRYSSDYNFILKSRISAQMADVKYTSRAPLAVEGSLLYDKEKGVVVINDSRLSINEMPIDFSGEIDLSDEERIGTAINIESRSFSLSRLMAMLTEESFPEFKRVDTDIALNMTASVTGAISSLTGEFPVVEMQFDIPGGYFNYKDVPARIEDFMVEGELYFDMNSADESYLTIDDMNLLATGVDMSAYGDLTNLMGDMRFEGSLKGSLDLDSLNRALSFVENMTAKGILSVGIITDVKLSDLSMANISRSKVLGSILADSLDIRIPDEDIFLIAGSSQMSFNSSNQVDDTGKDELVMTVVSFNMDTLDVRYKDEIAFAASDFEGSVGSDLAKIGLDSFKDIPLKMDINLNRLNLSLADSLSLRGQGFKGGVSILPAVGNNGAKLSLVADLSRMMFRDAENRAALSSPHIEIDAVSGNSTRRRIFTPGEESSSDRGLGGSVNDVESEEVQDRRLSFRQKRLDSLQLLYPDVLRDSLIVHNRRVQQQERIRDDFAAGDLDFSVDKSISDILRSWAITGEIRAGGGRVTTPYFPINNRVEGMDISFSNNQIDIKQADIRAGDSNLRMSGKISNLQRALTSGRTLRVDIDIISDSLDLDQVTTAAVAGMMYSELNEAEKQQLVEKEEDDMTEQLLKDAQDHESGLIVIPSNIDLRLGFDFNNGIYSGLRLDRLTGEILAKNRILKFNEVVVESSGGGIDLTALYATKNKREIMAGFDLVMRNIEVEKFINLVPSIDSLLPMLKSFEGVLNCEVAATADLDTLMNFILPSINGVCKISGEDMVLLDSDTFAQISKMLMFKNKKRNVIDDISVEIIIQNNQIEVFPFLMMMDRYQAAVSGVQDFDMNFKYHISVLKSPIPMRFGITFTGKPSDFKFKLGKALYKDTNLPVYTHVIDQTKLNLRGELNDIFIRGIENIYEQNFSRININTNLARQIEETIE